MSNLFQTIKNPWVGFEKWFSEAKKLNLKNYNAVSLATGFQNKISVRIVLLKEFNNQDGFVFYTNLSSLKGNQLKKNPYAAMVFYWDAVGRQIRIEGNCNFLTEAKTASYFNQRTRKSCIGAWASLQSQVMENRVKFIESYNYYKDKFKSKSKIPLPPNWRGVALLPVEIEFWQESDFRLHDRIKFFYENNQWSVKILYP